MAEINPSERDAPMRGYHDPQSKRIRDLEAALREIADYENSPIVDYAKLARAALRTEGRDQ